MTFKSRRVPFRLMAYLKFVRRHAIIFAATAALFLFVIIFLSHIPEHSSATEHLTYLESASLKRIFDDPLNAPYKLAVYISSQISKSVLAVRSVSILFLFLTSMAMYHTFRLWYAKKAALLATGAFSTNAVVLAIGRLGTPLVMVFGWFIFTAMLLWQVHGKSNRVIPGIVLIFTAFLLYTPGALWFFIVFAFFYWDRFRRAFKNVKFASVLLASILGIAVMSPLIYAFIRTPDTIRSWLLLPETFTLNDILHSVLQVPSSFIYSMPKEPLITVGRLPIFDLASGFLFLIGLNAYRKKLQLDRTRLMIAMGLIGIIIGSFGDVVTGIAVLLPFAYSVVAAGIEFLLDEWNGVFPKNPFAKSFGLIAVTTVVLFSGYYQLTRFLVVWPQTPETRTTYSMPRILE